MQRAIYTADVLFPFKHILNALRSGGIFICNSRISKGNDEYLYDLLKVGEALVGDGRMKLIRKTKVPYAENKTMSFVLVYQKIWDQPVTRDLNVQTFHVSFDFIGVSIVDNQVDQEFSNGSAVPITFLKHWTLKYLKMILQRERAVGL